MCTRTHSHAKHSIANNMTIILTYIFVFIRTEYPNYTLVNGFISRFQFPLATTTAEIREKKKTHTINFSDFSLCVFPHSIVAHFYLDLHVMPIISDYLSLFIIIIFIRFRVVFALRFFTQHTFDVLVVAVAVQIHWPIVSSFPNK